MKLKIRDITVFAMLGALMFASKLVMEILPNIHLIGVFVIATTVVYRSKALFPIYIFVFVLGVFNGFGMWWIPYLYVWTVLWGMVMLLPKKMPAKVSAFVYMLVCSLHGFLFGVLYAPAQAIMFGMDFEKTLLWIAAGLPFDMIHGISNFFCGILIIPIVKAINMANRQLS